LWRARLSRHNRRPTRDAFRRRDPSLMALFSKPPSKKPVAPGNDENIRRLTADHLYLGAD